MSLESALAAYVLRQPAVTALVGDRFDPVENPQGTAMPAIAYQTISRPREYSHDGGGLSDARVQLTISAATFTEVVAVADALRPVLAGRSFSDAEGRYVAFVENEMDGNAPASGQAGYFIRRMDVMIEF